MPRDGMYVAFAAVAIAAAAAMLHWSDDSDAESEAVISCAPADRAKLRGLDLLCSLWENHTRDATPATERFHDEVHVAVSLPLVQTVVALFLLCGECVVLGAVLFGSMVHATPGVGLRATPRATFASTLGIVSGVAYQVVWLSWWLGLLGLFGVIVAAPACQAVLTAAVALLYAAVVTPTTSAQIESDRPSASRRISPSVSLTHRMARFC